MLKYIHLLIILQCFAAIECTFAQSGTWVWLRGDSITGHSGNFGTKGVSSPSNEPPANYEPIYWTDKQGNLWMQGGLTYGYAVNNLWKYDILSNEWTWMNGPQNGTGFAVYGTQGVPSSLNYPGVTHFGTSCWVDSVGDLWLMGGAFNNVLWRYHIPTNEWTWMKGNSNFFAYNPPLAGLAGQESPAYDPGDRAESKSNWVYDNKLYIFGGQDSAGVRNDVWSYNISTNNWAYWRGQLDTGAVGSYGLKGIASPSNDPPARFSYSRWHDGDSMFYLFSGLGTSATNDLWSYNPKSNLWTWIGGASTWADTGTINPYCEASINYFPSSRMESSSLTAQHKCMSTHWVFGGINTNGIYRNDLWAFNASSLEWTKVKGESDYLDSSVWSYGTKGIPNITNEPFPRQGAAIWNDKQGNLYIFGGGNWNTSMITFNDLWKFIPDTNCVKAQIVTTSLFQMKDTLICSGDTLQIPIPPNINILVLPSGSSFIDTVNNVLKFFPTSNTDYTVIGQSSILNDPCFTNDTMEFSVNVNPLPIADFILTPAITTMDNPTFNLVNQSTNATSYAWYGGSTFLSNATDLVKTYSQVGTYCFTLVATNSCGINDSMTKCGEIISEGFVVIPTAFTPNDDGLNDVFQPLLINGAILETFAIYNRWGQRLFFSNGPKPAWNGRFKGVKCDNDTYFYLIHASSGMGKNLVYKGSFALLR